MKLLDKLLIGQLFFFSFLFFNDSLKAELLIVKRIQDRLVSLDESDARNYPVLKNILLNYRWPMVIANRTLTKEEKDELLTSDSPFAEEKFIRRKLHEEFKGYYDVFFIPTSIFELFVISQSNVYCKTEDFLLAKKKLDNLSENIIKILNTEEKNISLIHQRIYNVYQDINDAFYKNYFFLVNNDLVSFLLSNQTLNKLQNCDEISEVISTNVLGLGGFLIKMIIERQCIRSGGKALLDCESSLVRDANNNAFINSERFLAKFISLEYEVRNINKALLVRGSNPVKITLDTGMTINIMGTTIIEDDSDLKLKSIERYVSADKLKPISVSFGTTLFAGAYKDVGACTFAYLSNANRIMGGKANSAGFALFIDKKAYYEHEENRLFFIPPLAPIAALYASYEYFHARVKSTIVLRKQKDKSAPRGLGSMYDTGLIKDPAGILIINRNPFLHAALFSRFMAKNMRWLKEKGEEENLSFEQAALLEKQFKEAQEVAAGYYMKNYQRILSLQKFAKQMPQMLEKRRKTKVMQDDEPARKIRKSE